MYDVCLTCAIRMSPLASGWGFQQCAPGPCHCEETQVASRCAAGNRHLNEPCNEHSGFERFLPPDIKPR